MKYIYILLSILLLNYNVYSSETPKTDPFASANELYNSSNWTKAYREFHEIHGRINTGKIKQEKIDPAALIRGHVNYADVTFAIAATEYSKGNYEEAKKLMLQACKHWAYRLEGRQFGRAPLDNEWDGSDISGKKLLVYSERDSGAFGDTFYMTGMLRYAKKKGAEVIFVPQGPLAKLYDKQQLPDALQTQYVDQIALRGTELPQHDNAIYLWSILQHYLNDENVKQPFPIQPCLSGTKFSNDQLSQKITDLTKEYGQEPLLVGMWWRTSGSNSMAADWRMLDRDPGVQKMLKILQGLPILVINLEGLGHKPLSKTEYKIRKKNGTLGISDFLDVTTYSIHNVFNFDHNFDKEISFGDTIAIMQMIKEKGGILIGPDTGLCMAAAMVEKNKELYPQPSVFAILNKQADFRWGKDTTSPRSWYYSDDILIFQASQQGQWDEPLAQARTAIVDRIKILQ